MEIGENSDAPMRVGGKKERVIKKESTVDLENVITIDQVFQTSLKIGKVVEADIIKKSKKLLLLKVDVGEAEPRQIVAGIREYYTPESLIDTLVCVVANLKPAKLMGLLSEGMLLAAKDENGLALMRPEHPVKQGSAVS
jgi:methionyl-tRNA synthetase